MKIKWNDLGQNEYLEDYCKFMYNKNNLYNCEECPENINFKGVDQEPCGQYRCWVYCHCK